MANDSKTAIVKAPTYTEALVKAKTMFGSDFSIVSRRDIKESNLFSKLTSGKLGGDALAVELEIAPGLPEASEKKKSDAPPNPLLRSYTKALEGMEKHSPNVRKAMANAAAPYVTIGETGTGLAGRLDEFQKELRETRREYASAIEEMRMMLSLQARGGLPAVGPELLAIYRNLADKNIGDALARDIVEDLQRELPARTTTNQMQEYLLRSLARRIPCAGPVLPSEGRPTVVALVGASGVGKSTSVVKLAIHFTMHMGKSVGVINEDLRRPGADGQINNLGRMFGIGVTTATEATEIRDVVKSMSGREVILIDTGGRSPRDARGIERLAGILRAAGVDETHLLLSGVSSEETMRQTVRRFQPLNFNRVMLTKLDECITHGCLVNIGADLAAGLSYVTTGPDYTCPIEQADGVELAELVLGLRELEIDCDRTPGD